MFRKPKTIIICFVVAYSLIFLIAGAFVHHVYNESVRERVTEQRIRALEKRPRARMTVADDGSLEIQFDETTDIDR